MQCLSLQSLPWKSTNPMILSEIHTLNPKQLNFQVNSLNSHHRKTRNWRIRSSPEEESVANSSDSGDLKNSLSGIVGNRVEELLNREENKGLLDGLEKASMRVEVAKRELEEIERQEIEAKLLQVYVNQLESRASEIAECQQEIVAARSMVEEAERSLSLAEAEDIADENGYSIDKDKERLESAKAGAIAAAVGTLAELPFALSQVSSVEQLLLPLGIAFASCALFGVTFRYAVRRDLDDSHLKSGAVAAFGFVKGLGMLSRGPPLELSWESLVSHGIDGAVLVSQSVLIFAFASVGLDFCFKMNILRPFPSSSETQSK
ncbi:unnamed protein product [Arabis nemorensis]|uniref:Uncharacterized protein n=1 Tax=Arabis nemorensis TaxID=586526 RepID=A0A565CE69_9BRAS|nr:unnamed protein product [Arabis nemorensis]